MLTLFLGLTIGYCANKYTVIETLDDGKTANVEIIFGSFIKDCLWIFAVLGAVANWAIATGRNVRNYFDSALLPWLADFGWKIELPTLRLPVMAADDELNQTDLDELLEVQA